MALLVVTAIVALFTILFGELVPKALAFAYAERLAFLFARTDRRSWPGAGAAGVGAHHA